MSLPTKGGVFGAEGSGGGTGGWVFGPLVEDVNVGLRRVSLYISFSSVITRVEGLLYFLQCWR